MQEGKYICDSCVFWNKYSPMCMIKNIFHENREIKLIYKFTIKQEK
jgi:hypothetical protein